MSDQFQQLAFALVAQVKALSQHANSTNNLQVLTDSDLEKKLNSTRAIIELDFQIPSNMTISLTQIISKLLILKIPYNKDFILLPCLDLLKAVLAKCTDFNQALIKSALLDFIKWSITLIKDRNTIVTPEVQEKAFLIFSLISSSLNDSQNFLPAFSSLATKVITSEYKVVSKVRVIIVEIWEIVLLKFFNSFPKLSDKSQSKLQQSKITALVQKIKQKELEKPQFDQNLQEFVLRLNDCFAYINQNLHKSIQNSPLMQRLSTLAQNLIKNTQGQNLLQENSLAIQFFLSFNLLLLSYLSKEDFSVLKANQQPKQQISFELKSQVYDQFKKDITQLKKVKQCINNQERSLKLKKIQILLHLIQTYDIKIQREHDLNLFILNIKSLIEFQSQRYLIQELNNPIQVEQKPCQSGIKLYFMKNIDLFQNDEEFKFNIETLLSQLPYPYSFLLMENLQSEFSELNLEGETSRNLQQKCKLVYIMSYLALNHPDLVQGLVMVLLNSLDKADFNIKYPIQETYYASLYHSLMLIAECLPEKLEKVDLSIKNKLFIFAFSGLSSQLSILQQISQVILDTLMKKVGVKSVQELLELDNNYFFHNLFAKIRYSSTSLESNNKHLILVLKSLNSHSSPQLDEVIVNLISLVNQKLDQAMVEKSQQDILLSIDLSLVLSEHIRDFTTKKNPVPNKSILLEKIEQSQQFLSLDPEEQRKSKFFEDKIDDKALTNNLRRLILRISSYWTSDTQPQLTFKTLQIYQNLLGYLKNRELIKEGKAKNFSPEDADNVVIGCSLSAISYEVYPYLMSILKSNKGFPQKIKVVEVIQELVKEGQEFIFGMKRLEDDILPLLKVVAKEKTTLEHLKEKYIQSVTKLLSTIGDVKQQMSEEDRTRFSSTLNLSEEFLKELVPGKGDEQ